MSRNVAAVVLYPGCTIAEVIELATRLRSHGLEVVMAAIGTDPVVDQSGLPMSPTVDLTTLDVGILRVVVVPGGDPGSVIEDERMLGFLRAAGDSGATVAAICAGVLLSAAAGLTQGRHITHNYRAPWAPEQVERFVDRFWSGASVQPDPSIGVVVDGKLITALPNAVIDFTVTTLEQLDLIDAGYGALLRRHLGGEFVAELHEA